MLRNIEQYLNYQSIYLSSVDPFSIEDFILVVNDRVRKFYEDREKPDLGYTFFIDYLVNAVHILLYIYVDTFKFNQKCTVFQETARCEYLDQFFLKLI